MDDKKKKIAEFMSRVEDPDKVLVFVRNEKIKTAEKIESIFRSMREVLSRLGYSRTVDEVGESGMLKAGEKAIKTRDSLQKLIEKLEESLEQEKVLLASYHMALKSVVNFLETWKSMSKEDDEE